MNSRLHNYIKNLLLPCLFFSILTGFFAAILVTAFKFGAEAVIHLSTSIYEWVRENPAYLPALVLGAAAVGLISSFILSKSRSCRGGGIPTSVGVIRGVINFRWISSVFVLPFSALLTFLCGMPLGTEGPCVQMGTAIGDGVINCFGEKKHKAWRRYVMTGGASSGFSIATSSPITAILFSIEELNKQFSPMLLVVASICVVSSQITVQLLSLIGLESSKLFHLPTISAISPKMLFTPILIGIACGVCSILFTRFYHFIDKAIQGVLKKISVKVLFPIIFAAVSLVGFFLAKSLGTGHSLVDTLFEHQVLWYVLILVFLVRAIFMMASNTSGITGGVFLPTLAFGAIVGSLSAEGMIALGWIDSEYYLLMVVLGVTAFLGSTSRIPITACVFAVETLGGINNVIPILIATIVALLIVETSGVEDFTDTVLESKIHAITKGRKPVIIEVPLTVQPDSFVIGKEFHDILWPNTCVVVSFDRKPENRSKFGIAEGDVITVHYKTYHNAHTAEEITALVGEQAEEINQLMDPEI